ncbi:MAG: DUF47 family protein [Bacteroidota bacterium]
MLKFLIPKEEKYFQYFNEMIANVVAMAELTKKLFSELPYNAEVIHQIKSLEKRCDEISSRVIKKLNKTFITPFDREDILTLTKRIEGVSNALKSLAVRLEIVNLDVALDSAIKLTEIIHLQVTELQAAISKLKERDEVENHCKVVKDLESEADIIHQETLKKIFATTNDAVMLIKKRDILDMLEKTIDRNQLVANLILIIFIKNS